MTSAIRLTSKQISSISDFHKLQTAGLIGPLKPGLLRSFIVTFVHDGKDNGFAVRKDHSVIVRLLRPSTLATDVLRDIGRAVANTLFLNCHTIVDLDPIYGAEER